jgi:hypothetical protein
MGYAWLQFQFGKKKAAPKVIRETVIPEPDYRIPLVLLGTNLLPTLSFCRIVCVNWEEVHLQSFISAYFCVWNSSCLQSILHFLSLTFLLN